jgi:hypothetical protein
VVVIPLRDELQAIVLELLAGSERTGAISLDTLGDAIGTRAVSQAEIDAMLTQLEDAGRRVVGADDMRGEAHLKIVLATARAYSSEFGRRPKLAELAVRSGLSIEQVRHALTLAKIMQR